MLMNLPVQNQPTPSPVTSLMVYLTEECNLRCSYCFVNKKPRPMSRETALKILHFFLRPDVSREAKQLNLNFFGGEPFLQVERMQDIWKEWQRLSPASKKSLKFGATTNGTLAGPRVERIIKETQMVLLVSLDGEAQTHEHRPLISGRSSYSLVVKNLPKLIQWSPCTSIRVTFHPQSLDLVGSVRRAMEFGAHWILLGPVVEADWRGCEQVVEEQFQELAEWFLSEVFQSRVPPLKLTWGALRLWHQLRPLHRRPSRPCPVGGSLLAIDPDGNVMPCHRFLYRPKEWLGHLDGHALSQKRHVYDQLRTSDILGCDDCLARPICGGGCRVVSLQSGGGLYGTHPFHCLITRAHARMVERIYNGLQTHPDFKRVFAAPVGPDIPEAFLESAY